MWAQKDRERLATAQEKLKALESASLPLRLELQQLDARIHHLQVERIKLIRQIQAAEKGAFPLRDEIAGLLIQHGPRDL